MGTGDKTGSVKNLAEPRLVVRNGRAEGILYSIRGDVPLVLKAASADQDFARLTKAVHRAIGDCVPELVATLGSVEMAMLVAAKRNELERFWASHDLPLVNETMVRPRAVVDADSKIEIFYDSETNRRFDHVMALRSLIEDYLEPDPKSKLEVYQALARVVETFDGKPAILPAIDATALGANVVRIVRSQRCSWPVAIFTVSGDLTIGGSSAGPDRPRAVIASTGGVICPEKEGNADFDVLAAAGRELAEETGLGFVGPPAFNVALFTQHDGQLATQQVQDLCGVDDLDFGSQLAREIDALRSGGTSRVVGFDLDDEALDDKLTKIEKALVDHGVTFEFFDEIRHLAPDAAEAKRYLAVPLTEECLSYLLLCPWLDRRSWTATMLVGLIDCYFGQDSADRVLALMAREPTAEGGFIELAGRMPVSPDLQFLETQLLDY